MGDGECGVGVCVCDCYGGAEEAVLAEALHPAFIGNLYTGTGRDADVYI